MAVKIYLNLVEFVQRTSVIRVGSGQLALRLDYLLLFGSVGAVAPGLPSRLSLRTTIVFEVLKCLKLLEGLRPRQSRDDLATGVLLKDVLSLGSAVLFN